MFKSIIFISMISVSTFASESHLDCDLELDRSILPGYTRAEKIENFLNNSEKIFEDIDKAASDGDRPLLKEMAREKIFAVSEKYKRSDIRKIAQKFQEEKEIEEIASDIVTVLKSMKVKELKKRSVSAENGDKIQETKKSLPRRSYDKKLDIEPQEIQDISHGGGLFYIIEFLLGMVEGYPDDDGCNPNYGIYVRAMGENDRDAMFMLDSVEHYAVDPDHATRLDYPAMFFGEIEAQYLDEVPKPIEAVLKSENRNKLKKIKIKLLPDAEGISKRYSVRTSPQEKVFIISKLQSYITRLQSYGAMSEYRILAASAIQELIISLS